MAEAAIRTETRADAAGSYTAYIFADGHVETEPAGRPLYKEDLIRRRKAEMALRDPVTVVAADTAANTLEGAGARQARLATNARLFAPGVPQGLEVVQRVPVSAAAGSNDRQRLLTEYDLGGVVVGPLAGLRPEYDRTGEVS